MEDLYDRALEAIRDIFEDSDLSSKQRLDTLAGLQDEISLFMQAIETDIQQDDEEAKESER